MAGPKDYRGIKACKIGRTEESDLMQLDKAKSFYRWAQQHHIDFRKYRTRKYSQIEGIRQKKDLGP